MTPGPGGHRQHRRDRNHDEIVDVFRASGASVVSLVNVGGGVPDLLVGFHRKNALVEVKPERGKLRDSQREWHESWRGGHIYIVRSREDVQTVLEALR